MLTIGQPCIYLPNGSPCEILRLYPDRHRARIKIAETGREIDEVAWHDLAARVEAVVPKVPEVEAKAPPGPVATEDPEKGGTTYAPRSLRKPWLGGGAEDE